MFLETFKLTEQSEGYFGARFWDPPDDFEEWMSDNCPSATCTYRFNSGNPAYYITIPNEKEAMLFLLKWSGK